MQFKKYTKHRNGSIQGLRSFKDTLPKNIKKVINKRGHVYSETLNNWKYIVGENLFKFCYPKSYKNSNKFGVGTLLIMVKRGHEVDLEYSKKKIMDKMNGFFNDKIIEKIKFTSFDDEEKIVNEEDKLNLSVTKDKFNNRIRDIKNDQVIFSELKNNKTDDLFKVQDKFVLSVVSKFNLEEDKIRVSNDDIVTIEELRLLQFAAKEREKWSRNGYFDYEKTLDELYSINPNGYAHNLSQAWKYHYKIRLGFCKPQNKKATKKERKATTTNCFLKAIKFASKAIEINPKKADAYLAKGYFLASLYIINR